MNNELKKAVLALSQNKSAMELEVEFRNAGFSDDEIVKMIDEVILLHRRATQEVMYGLPTI